MMNSMTGYGQASGLINGQDYAVEIKAVNNRYLRTSIRLPEAAAFMEDRIERLLRQHVARGTVNYSLRIKGAAAKEMFDINEPVLRTVTQQLADMAQSMEAPCTCDVSALLTLPGVVQPAMPDEETTQLITEGLLALTEQALAKFQGMRQEEGRFLSADLKSHCDVVREELASISERCDQVIHTYADRIRKRVNALLSEAKLKLDEDTLAREVAILAERADIAEELSRLDSHMHQFAKTCDQSEEPAGRRLDFIAQEMLREANTIASKAGDTDICNRVVNIKCRIDRLKEQIQNVE
ncbi:MAG: YicC family protein [Planctomycetes bacterium]|nr:YicC family protein [Planctomycetota bacterium]